MHHKSFEAKKWSGLAKPTKLKIYETTEGFMKIKQDVLFVHNRLKYVFCITAVNTFSSSLISML